ncbi:hypothetical protein [Planococcus sp. YIM B11945]
MLRLIDDLAGAIHDLFRMPSYLLAGMLLVGVPLYAIAWILKFISEQFFQ